MKFAAAVLSVLVGIVAAHSVHEPASSWTYTGKAGVDHWAETYEACGGKSQSPIDVSHHFTVVAAFEPFYFTHYHEVLNEAEIINNGHALEVKMIGNNHPVVSGGNLDGNYTFAQYHLHWGADDTSGSEHTVNHVRYPMEMHFVHYKTEYGSVGEAVAKPDGLAVISVLFVISAYDNPAIEPIVALLKERKDAGITKFTSNLYPLTSMLPRDLSRFYRYQGSLTTPPCSEVVTWSIMDDYVSVSEKQIRSFRSLQDSRGAILVNNFRPSQALNGRQVYRSFKK